MAQLVSVHMKVQFDHMETQVDHKKQVMSGHKRQFGRMKAMSAAGRLASGAESGEGSVRAGRCWRCAGRSRAPT